MKALNPCLACCLVVLLLDLQYFVSSHQPGLEVPDETARSLQGAGWLVDFDNSGCGKVAEGSGAKEAAGGDDRPDVNCGPMTSWIQSDLGDFGLLGLDSPCTYCFIYCGDYGTGGYGQGA